MEHATDRLSWQPTEAPDTIQRQRLVPLGEVEFIIAETDTIADLYRDPADQSYFRRLHTGSWEWADEPKPAPKLISARSFSRALKQAARDLNIAHYVESDGMDLEKVFDAILSCASDMRTIVDFVAQETR